MATSRGVRAALVLVLGGVGLIVSACSVPTPVFSSPFIGVSAPNVVFSDSSQSANIAVCSATGGPIKVIVDLADSTSTTILTVSLVGNVHWIEDPDASTYFSETNPPTHVELTTIDELAPGECENVVIRTSNWDATPAPPFSFAVAW